MPGTPQCEMLIDKDKCKLFEVEYVKYNAPSSVTACHLNATQAEIVFSIKGVYTGVGGEQWCELLLMESAAGTSFQQIAFADDVQPPKAPAFQTGYIRLYKTVNSTLIRQFKILVKKADATFNGQVKIICKFRHGRDFQDSCAWKDNAHTLSIIIDVE